MGRRVRSPRVLVAGVLAYPAVLLSYAGVGVLADLVWNGRGTSAWLAVRTQAWSVLARGCLGAGVLVIPGALAALGSLLAAAGGRAVRSRFEQLEVGRDAASRGAAVNGAVGLLPGVATLLTGGGLEAFVAATAYGAFSMWLLFFAVGRPALWLASWALPVDPADAAIELCELPEALQDERGAALDLLRAGLHAEGLRRCVELKVRPPLAELSAAASAVDGAALDDLVRILTHCGPAAEPLLLDLLERESASHAWPRAIAALARHGGAASLALLERRARSLRPSVRDGAARALTRIRARLPQVSGALSVCEDSLSGAVSTAEGGALAVCRE